MPTLYLTAPGGGRLIVTAPDATSPAAYAGRPAIAGLASITPRIVVSRTTGTAPMHVQVSACETTWAGPSGANAGEPYGDLHYTWDFGESGVHSFTNPVTGLAMDPGTDQVGPEAAYVYRTPGEYAITLTAWGWDGTRYRTASTTTLVTLSASYVKSEGSTAGTYTLRAFVGHAPVRSARLNRSAGAKSLHRVTHAVRPSASGFAVSFWFRNWYPAAVEQTLLSLYRNTSGNRAFRVSLMGATGELRLTVGTTDLTTSTGGLYDDGAWHHVHAEADVANSIIRLKVDGGTAVTAARSGTLDAASAVPFLLGGYFSGTAPQTYCNADLDEVAAWDRPLTSGESSWLYNAGSGRRHEAVASGQASLATGMLAWWGMDEEYGDRADASGNAQHLTDAAYHVPGVSDAPGVWGVEPRVTPAGGEETAPIAHDATMEEIVAALELLPSIGSGNARAAGDALVEFCGDLAGTPVAVVAGTTAGGYDGALNVVARGDFGASAATVTASAWDATRHPARFFDSTAGVDGDGLTSATPSNSAATLAAVLAWPGGGARVFLKRGSDFTAPGLSWNLSNGICSSPTMIAAYGAGPRPILRASSTVLRPSMEAYSPFAGVTIDGVELRTDDTECFRHVPDPNFAGYASSCPPSARGFWFLDCALFAGEAGCIDGGVIYLASGEDAAFWGSTVTRGAPRAEDEASHCQALFVTLSRWCSVAGSTFEGGGSGQAATGLIHAHHLYMSVVLRQLYRWCDFRPTTERPAPDTIDGYTHYRLNFSIKFAAEYGHIYPFVVLDGCKLAGTQNSYGLARQNTTAENPPETAFDRVVISGNALSKLAGLGTQSIGGYVQGVGRITLRDNLYYGVEEAISLSSNEGDGPARVDATIHRNRIHVASGTGPAVQFYYDAAKGQRTVARAEVLDNVAVHEGADACLVRAHWGHLETAAAVIDRNQYWAPNDADGAAFSDAAVTTAPTFTLADWQAAGYDANGAVANPNWADAPNGDFSTP
jgi:Concanavalin A-like lectin/glucanases superfamily/PKD domain